MPDQNRNTLSTTQPGKTVLTTLHLLFNAARLPFWMVYFIPKGLRQDSRWSYSKALKVRIVRAFLTYVSHVETKTPWDLTPNKEKHQWTTVQAADSKYFTGITLADNEIKPVTIGGTWYPSPPSASNPVRKVALHYHGGAYVIGDGRTEATAFLCNNLLKHAGVSHVFSTQYRLSSNAGGRFPAALQDAISAYVYLLNEMKISPSDIVVTGDSAGGNLTLSLLRYIADHGAQLNLPSPSCAWLWSPWVNPGSTMHDTGPFDSAPQNATDYLNGGFGQWGAQAYAPAKSSGVDMDSEYINFSKHQFKTDTPLYFSICENEVLLHDDKTAYDAFTKIKGNTTEMSIETAAPHDVILVGKMVGFEAEAAEAARKAGKYLANL